MDEQFKKTMELVIYDYLTLSPLRRSEMLDILEKVVVKIKEIPQKTVSDCAFSAVEAELVKNSPREK